MNAREKELAKDASESEEKSLKMESAESQFMKSKAKNELELRTSITPYYRAQYLFECNDYECVVYVSGRKRER